MKRQAEQTALSKVRDGTSFPPSVLFLRAEINELRGRAVVCHGRERDRCWSIHAGFRNSLAALRVVRLTKQMAETGGRFYADT
jgi:hypothetical protein